MSLRRRGRLAGWWKAVLLGRNGVDSGQEFGVVDQQGFGKRSPSFQANLFPGVGALSLANLTIVPPEGAAVRS